MKSIAFRNLVLGFYFCVGFLVFVFNRISARSFIPLTNDLITNHNDTPYSLLDLYAVCLTLPFFIGVIICFFYRKFWICNVVYLCSAFIIYSLCSNQSILDVLIETTYLITVLIFLVSFSIHPHFSQSIPLIVNNNILLDEFETRNRDEIEKKLYFLKINKIFSFAFISVGIGVLLSTFYIDFTVYFYPYWGFMFLGFILIGFAPFLKKFPKIASWITVFICMSIFLFIEIFFLGMTFFNESSQSQTMRWDEVISILGVGFSFLFLALIVISKIAREEWKMK